MNGSRAIKSLRDKNAAAARVSSAKDAKKEADDRKLYYKKIIESSQTEKELFEQLRKVLLVTTQSNQSVVIPEPIILITKETMNSTQLEQHYSKWNEHIKSLRLIIIELLQPKTVVRNEVLTLFN